MSKGNGKGPDSRKRPFSGFSADDPRARRLELLEQRKQLPMWSAREKLVKAVQDNKVLIVVGETGSGKTTQIPQFLLQAGLSQGGMIACTQPRRVAAVAVARRVAEEMGTVVGQKVGYSIRFEDVTSPSTRIKYLTDGMLLREALLDPLLKKYKVVVVDEAHERTVQTDVVFGLLKSAQARREDGFRLVVMSATLDASSFVSYFPGSKAVYVQGRQFPVSIMYTAAPQPNYLEAALTAALQIHIDEEEGDILIFLTGQEEIESAERLLADRAAALPEGAAALKLLVTPIYAAMPPDQQMKVFAPPPTGHRKAILATNIAETSLTISGVRYVVDPGFVKARAYNARAGFDSLEIVPVSQAQARQRSGRAGREAPGKVYRLYTESTFQQLPPTTLPEILRSNLATVVLQLKAMGVHDVLNFDFVDPPPKAALIRSLELLLALGALDQQGGVTEGGARMAKLPVEPMFGKVLLASGDMGCSREALAVAAMVSSDSIFFKPSEKRAAAEKAHAKFKSHEGDHLTLLTVFKSFKDTPHKQQTQWCSDSFLNIRALRKATDVYTQLERHLQDLSIPLKSCGDDSTAIRRALTAGLFVNSAKLQPDNTYKVVATGQAVWIHPNSVLPKSGKRPECIIFNELVRTTKQYCRDCCIIEPRWLPELAPIYFAAKASAQLGGVPASQPHPTQPRSMM